MEESNKLNLKCKSSIAKSQEKPKHIWRKRTEQGELSLPDIRVYHKAAGIRTMCYWYWMDQWNRVVCVGRLIHVMGTICYRGAIKDLWRKNNFFLRYCGRVAIYLKKGTYTEIHLCTSLYLKKTEG